MRIAICFSGQIRTGVESSDSILDFIGDMIGDVDIFIHTWDTNTPSRIYYKYENPLDDGKYSKEHLVPESEFDEIKEIYKPKSMIIDKWKHHQENRRNMIITKNDGVHGSVIPLFYSVQRSNELRIEYAELTNTNYDFIFKFRFDQRFSKLHTLKDEIKWMGSQSDVLYVNDVFNKLPNDVEDIMWGGTTKVFNIASNVNSAMENDPNCGTMDWQQYLKKYLDEHNVLVKGFKNNELTILRNNTHNRINQNIRIAICFSGQIRTGLDAAENIKNFIGDLYPNCDFFVHTWTHNTTPNYINNDNPLPEVYSPIDDSVFDLIKELYSPKKMVVEDSFMKDNRDRHVLGFMERFYTWERSVEYKTEYEIEHGFEYDYVVKLRFDLVYAPTVKLSDLLSRILPGFFGSEHLWISSGHPTIDDCIWMSDSKTMNLATKWNQNFYIENHKYNDVFEGNPGWQVYFYAYLNLNGVYPYNLLLSQNGTWAALRFECVGYDPTVDFEKIREIDRQLFWEDTNFKYLVREDLVKLKKILKEKYNYSSEHINKIINDNKFNLI